MSFVYTGIIGAGVGTTSTFLGADAQNESIEQAIKNSQRRYALKSSIAENQMTEQEQEAMGKMTDVARAFLKAKGTAKAVQAESGVGGNVQKIQEFQLASKEAETKGKVAKEIDTNVINIAQDMLANKIDTEAMIDEAISQGSYGADFLLDTAIGGVGGATSAISLVSAFKKG